MDAAKAEVLAFATFPRPHWPKIWSTNPWSGLAEQLGRVNAAAQELGIT
jgi:putative transposase